MPSKVILECVAGALTGSRISFEDREVCILGRSPECRPALPNDEAHSGISRHHCLIDINPPEIRVRDFGSLNGTFVNGNRIGGREKGTTPETARAAVFPEHDLDHGDLLQVGGTAFKVLLERALYCNSCGDEMDESGSTAPGNKSQRRLCSHCRTRAETLRSDAPKDILPRCLACGEEIVRAESSNALVQTQLCDRCRNNSDRVVDYAAEISSLSEAAGSGLGRYRIAGKIGHGGMGAVYEAVDRANNQTVALKVMLPEVAVNSRNVELFLRETDVSRALDHRNVVKLYDSGYERGIFYICMAFCNGGSVEEKMFQAGGRLSLDESLGIIYQVLDALEYAHGRALTPRSGEPPVVGIVHRDVKPKNILLDTSGGETLALLCDFGLSKAFDLAGLSGLTCTGNVAGSPVYMPRQQVLNFKYSKPEVDVWATAASLYHMLTGKFPRDFPKNADPWRMVLETSAVPIKKRNPDVPDKVAKVIDQALIDRPEIRFKTAQEFGSRLRAAVAK